MPPPPGPGVRPRPGSGSGDRERDELSRGPPRARQVKSTAAYLSPHQQLKVWKMISYLIGWDVYIFRGIIRWWWWRCDPLCSGQRLLTIRGTRLLFLLFLYSGMGMARGGPRGRGRTGHAAGGQLRPADRSSSDVLSRVRENREATWMR
uniref:Uncharacterized protein n=1 Tax=Aegilops tauschii subsp. strangulata TaxID=200361 RepID=A0A453JK62_AEGTS